jgi:hypothetical protein
LPSDQLRELRDPPITGQAASSRQRLIRCYPVLGRHRASAEAEMVFDNELDRLVRRDR